MAYGANKSSDVKSSGIPQTVTDDPYVIATKVFTAMGLRNSDNCIFHARELRFKKVVPQSTASVAIFEPDSNISTLLFCSLTAATFYFYFYCCQLYISF